LALSSIDFIVTNGMGAAKFFWGLIYWFFVFQSLKHLISAKVYDGPTVQSMEDKLTPPLKLDLT